ncbi:AP-3 complex subunit beta-1 [Wickerhamomyces ciferrii]|uniref:AP-3 complex subunit beta-1 n=1 Tax=Wickerhamomyces ciferrii (strain ATCC 14091 / BCRC 22168 / CBS 111 / JCM 3599 / NBRC 0793 / NRRL Y-1031 F-60-10) TaxID=1206466 RepID=K0KUN2_WICCF|nr:AP-3 complex subunit beta-1 [Wickerhamomyces ciferrii]CCH45139.1 AP-3 complex subunit beta-1 [Wickerhamomyces ciferrii]
MSESITRITSMLESARDLTLEAAAAASAKLAETPDSVRPKEVSALLNSRYDRDVLKGLKYVISLISSGEDASKYFTDVVKNVTSTNLKTRKLVYTYLLRYADKENDVALLSINAIQKSLGDTNDQVRALAIRVMSEIKISSIYPIVQLGIKKCINDISPNVRKAAALSLAKVYYNHGESSVDELTDHLKKLLKDKDSKVLSSAILAFRTITPDKFELLHGHFRRFCSIFGNLDEWAQVYLIEIFTDYCRLYIPKPKIYNGATNEKEFIDLPDNYNEIPYPVYDVEYDSDLKLFLDSIKYLVYSSNEAVILAVGRAYFHLTPPKTFKESQISAAFVRALQTSTSEIQVFILQSILYMAAHDPTLFVQYEKRFYLFPGDHFLTAQFKLKVLSIICNENNIRQITNELQYYVLNTTDPKIAVESVKSLGACSHVSDYWSSKALKWLLSQVPVPGYEKSVTAEFLTVIRYLVQQNPENNVKVVIKLANFLDDISLLDSNAKESIIWLVGEFAGIESRIGPDVLRKLAKTFAFEQKPVRQQILLLSAKLYSYDVETYKLETGDHGLENYRNENRIVCKLFNHIINLAKYDDDYDVRDRSRLLNSLLSSRETQLATLILQAPKPVPVVALRNTNDKNNTAGFTDDDWGYLGIEEMIKNFNTLPEWSAEGEIPEKSIRDEIDVSVAPKSFSQQSVSSRQNFINSKNDITKPANRKFKLQSLDDFFAEDDLRLENFPRKTVIVEESDTSDEEEDDDDDEEEEEDDDDDGEDEDDDDEGKKDEDEFGEGSFEGESGESEDGSSDSTGQYEEGDYLKKPLI